MSVNLILENVKTALGVTSDYALAQQLQISRSTICGYNKNEKFLDARMCAKVAHILGENPYKLIATMELCRAERNNNEKLKNFWMEEIENLQ
jgi:predicted transcriptional regulator